jgi:hypothetical protein
VGFLDRTLYGVRMLVRREDPEVPSRIGPARVVLSRGVADYVNRRGGRLYLWSEPTGAGFHKARASTDRPSGVAFVTSGLVPEFELLVWNEMVPWDAVRLSRRWWGLRDGLRVTTGMWFVGSG